MKTYSMIRSTRTVLNGLLLTFVALAASGLLAQAPLESTILYVDNVDAQTGTQGDPVAGINHKPYFSAIFNHSGTTETATDVKVQFSTDSAFTAIVATSGWKSLTSGTIGARFSDIHYGGSALDCGNSYFWRIRVKDSTGTVGPWSTEAASFTVIECPLEPTILYAGNDEAQTGTQGSPVAGLNSKPYFSAIYNHSGATEPAASAKLQFATDAAFANKVATTGWKTVAPATDGTRLSDIHYGGNKLDCNTTYYWRIRVQDNFGTVGPWSTEAASFTTVACPHEATVLFTGNTEAQTGTQGDPVIDTSLKAYFSAIVLHDSPTTDIVEGKIQFASDAGFVNKFGSSGWKTVTPVTSGNRCSDIHHTWNNLPGNAQVWWRIKFKDTTGVIGTWSTEPASLITVDAPTESDVLFVDSTNAQGGTQGNPVTGIDLDPVFSAVFHHQDPASIAKKTKVQVATDSAFSNVIWTGTSIASNTADGLRVPDVAYAGPALIAATTYYWRVRNKDQNNFWSLWSTEVASFTTSGGATPAAITVSIDGGFTALLQGRTHTATFTKADGAVFQASNTISVNGSAVTATVIGTPTANAMQVEFAVSYSTEAGSHSIQVFDGTTEIANGSVNVFYPARHIAVRNTSIAQEPLRNAATGGYSTVLSSGEFIFNLPLVSLPGRMLDTTVDITYRSGLDYNGPVGRNWTASFESRIVYWAGFDEVHLHSGDGRIDVFALASGGTSSEGPYVNDEFYMEFSRDDASTTGDNSDDTFTLATPDGSTVVFEFNGVDSSSMPVFGKTSFTDRHGNTLAYIYNTEGQLTEIRGDLYDAGTPDRYRLVLGYGTDGRLATITDYADFSQDTEVADILGSYTGARVWEFKYDSLGRMSQVWLPKTKDWHNETAGIDGRARILFIYNSGTGADQILIKEIYAADQANKKLDDDSGLPWLVNEYDVTLRVDKQHLGRTSPTDTDHTYHIIYGANSADVVDPVGSRMHYVLDSNSRVASTQQHTGFYDASLTEVKTKLRASDPATFDESFEYNNAGELVKLTMPKGNILAWFYDVSNTSVLARGNLLRDVSLVGTASTTGLPTEQQNGLLTTYTYESMYNQLETSVNSRAYDLAASYDITQTGQVARDDSAKFTTTYIFDASGNQTEMQAPVISVDVSPSTPNAGQQYKVKYEYNQFGQVKRETDISDYGTTGQVGSDIKYEFGTTGHNLGLLTAAVEDPDTVAFRTEFEYDNIGRQRILRDNASSEWESHPDQLNRVVRARSPQINILGSIRYETRRTFDRSGNVVKLEKDDPLFNISGNLSGSVNTTKTVRMYSLLGDIASTTEDVTSSTTRTTTNVFDENYRVLESKSSSGAKSATSFDERGRTFKTYTGLKNGETDLSQAISSYQLSYDENGNTSVVIDSRNFQTTTIFDAFDRSYTRTDARTTPTVITNSYDNAGNLISTKTIGAFGDCSQASAPTRILAHSEFFFDNAGRQYRRGVLALDADGTTPLVYATRLTGVTDDKPSWNMITNDLLPDGRSYRNWNDLLDAADHSTATPNTTIGYDSLLRVTSNQDAVGNTVTTTYDGGGFVETISDSRLSQYDDSFTSLVRTNVNDELGRPITNWVTKDGGTTHPTNIRYGAFNRPVYEDLIGNQEKLRVYDLAGRPISMTNKMDGVWALSGSDISQNSTLTSTSTFTYDDDDHIATVTEADGTTVHTKYYDLAGRMVQSVTPSGKKHTIGSTNTITLITGTVAYAEVTDGYDKSGNILELNDIGSNIISRTYGPDSSLTTSSIAPSNAAAMLGERSATFTCDGMGRVIASTSTDSNSIETARTQTWSTAGNTVSQSISVDSTTIENVTQVRDPLGREQDRVDQLTSTTLEASFDRLNRGTTFTQKNGSGNPNATFAKTFYGRGKTVDAMTDTDDEHFRTKRTALGKPLSTVSVSNTSSEISSQTEYEYDCCGGLRAVIFENSAVIGEDKVYGTRNLVDGGGRMIGRVQNATFPTYTGSQRYSQWDMNYQSVAEVSILDINGFENNRAVFVGEKADLQGANGVIPIVYDSDGYMVKTGDIPTERDAATYPMVTSDGLFDYKYDHARRLISKTRLSDGKVLESVKYDSIGLPVEHDFTQMMLKSVDLSTSEVMHTLFTSQDVDLNGGGANFQGTDENHLEFHFPTNVRPVTSNDSFQGGEKSYHDFLIEPNKAATIKFVDLADSAQLEFRISGYSVAIYYLKSTYDFNNSTWSTVETLLNTVSLSVPTQNRMMALGIMLDVGVNFSTAHDVSFGIWSNGSVRLTSQTFQTTNTNFAPTSIQVHNNNNGAKLYKYTGYLDIPVALPSLPTIGADFELKKWLKTTMGLDVPPSVELQTKLIGTIEQLKKLKLDMSENAQALALVDYESRTGVSDAMSRNWSEGMRAGSMICQRLLLTRMRAIDRAIDQVIADTESLLKHVASQLLAEGRINQIDQYREAIEAAQTVDVEIVNGNALYLKIRNVPGINDADVFITSGTCAIGGKILGSYGADPDGLNYGFPVINGPNGSAPCERIEFWIMDGCGNLFIVGAWYACFDVFPMKIGVGTGTTTEAEIQKILNKVKFRAGERMDRLSAMANADLNKIIDNMKSPFEKLGISAADLESELEGLKTLFDGCSSVFENEEFLATLDKIGTFLLTEIAFGYLTGGGIGLLVKGFKYFKKVKDARKAANAAKILKEGGKYGDDILKGGLCFVAGSQVPTDDGLKNIEDIKVGDMVWGRSDVTGEQALKSVTHLFATHPVELIHLSYCRASGSAWRGAKRSANSNDDEDSDSLRDGALAKSSTLIGTRVHPFWSIDRQDWVDMGDLYAGESMRLLDGSVAVVLGLQTEHAACLFDNFEQEHTGPARPTGSLGTPCEPTTGTFTTYNFEVADWHTYFVGPENLTTTADAVWVHNLNTGVCQAGKDFLKRLKDAGVSPEMRRKAFEAWKRQLGGGRLKSIGNGQWQSGSGLIYGQGSAQGNRVLHVLEHAAPNPSKPLHSVFNAERHQILGIVDDAWRMRGNPVPGDPGAFVVPMGRVVGTQGETAVRIVVKPGTSQIITAYPVIP